MQAVLRHDIEPEPLRSEVFLGWKLEVAPGGQGLDVVHEAVPLELQLVSMISEREDVLLDSHRIELCSVGHRALLLRTSLEVAQRFATSFRGVREWSDVLREGDDLEATQLLQVLEDPFFFSLVPHERKLAQRDYGHAATSSSA
jgi:hypothetical protein